MGVCGCVWYGTCTFGACVHTMLVYHRCSYFVLGLGKMMPVSLSFATWEGEERREAISHTQTDRLGAIICVHTYIHTHTHTCKYGTVHTYSVHTV